MLGEEEEEEKRDEMPKRKERKKRFEIILTFFLFDKWRKRHSSSYLANADVGCCRRYCC
jgi:hypothetical protein